MRFSVVWSSSVVTGKTDTLCSGETSTVTMGQLCLVEGIN